MIKIKRREVALIILTLMITTLAGCVNKTATTASQVSSKTEESVKNTIAANAGTHQITDMAGRKVTIPTKVDKVISLSNNATIYVYTLAPDKLMGWSFTPKPEAKKYMDEKYFNLPVIGTTADKKIDYENIIKLKPDIIVCSDEDAVYSPDDIQKQLNIPVIKLDVSLEATDKVYTFLGECLGMQERAKKLADFSRNALDNIKAIIEKVPQDKRVKVYYAEGAAWLQTDIAKNVHTEVLDFAGGKNVADISEERTGSMAQVSMEQVLSWNPEVILVGATAAKGDFYSQVYNDEVWGKIKAVKDKKVYKIPALPFNWFDRPPCSARIIGVEWLANLLYPEYAKIDLNMEMKTFYETFYNYKLTDLEIQDLLTDAIAE